MTLGKTQPLHSNNGNGSLWKLWIGRSHATHGTYQQANCTKRDEKDVSLNRWGYKWVFNSFCFVLRKFFYREIWTTYLAFLIQQIQNSQFGLDEINAGLIVVEINQGPRNLFPHVFFLLQLKDVLCERAEYGSSGQDYSPDFAFCVFPGALTLIQKLKRTACFARCNRLT